MYEYPSIVLHVMLKCIIISLGGINIMKKHMKKIIIGGAILIVLGFGSVAIYHGINKNVPEPIEKATDTDAYVSNEDNAGNDVSTTAFADNSKDKDTTTEKDKEDSKDTSTEMASNTGDTSSANTGNHTTITNNGGTQNTNSGNSNNSSGNVNGNTNGGTKPSTHQTSGNVQPTTNGNTNNNGSNTNNSSVTPAQTSTATTESAKEDTTPKACEHAWKEVTQSVWVKPVEHTEEVEVVVTPEGYTTEYKTEWHAFCCNCGDMGVMSVDSIIEHTETCQGGASYWFDDVEVPVQVWHDAVIKTETKTVVDKEGYYKEEVVGYKCTKCGATKGK